MKELTTWRQQRAKVHLIDRTLLKLIIFIWFLHCRFRSLSKLWAIQEYMFTLGSGKVVASAKVTQGSYQDNPLLMHDSMLPKFFA